MTRGQKKSVYGLLYLVVPVLIVWAFWPSASPVPPPCSGPSCGTNQPLPLQVSGVPEMFFSKSARRVVMLGQVTNPNSNYGANPFSYRFHVFDRNGRTVSSVPGNGVIYPSEIKYILGVYDAGGADMLSLAERPGFEVNGASFQPAGSFLKPDLALISGPSVQINADNVVISGTLKNRSSFPAQNVSIVALLLNKYGDPLFAVQTLIRRLDAFDEAPVSISLPADDAISPFIDASKTAVFLSAD